MDSLKGSGCPVTFTLAVCWTCSRQAWKSLQQVSRYLLLAVKGQWEDRDLAPAIAEAFRRPTQVPCEPHDRYHQFRHHLPRSLVRSLPLCRCFQGALPLLQKCSRKLATRWAIS